MPVSKKEVVKLDNCRACDSSDLLLFLQLGPTPVPNGFFKAHHRHRAEKFYPLDICFHELVAPIRSLYKNKYPRVKIFPLYGGDGLLKIHSVRVSVPIEEKVIGRYCHKLYNYLISLPLFYSLA